MQTPEAIERVAAECVEDLAADGIVYAEIRMAPELLTDGGLTLDEAVKAMLDGLRRGAEGRPITVGTDRDRHASGGALGGDRRAGRPAPRRRRGRLRHRRAGGGLSAHAPPGRLPPHRPRELPLHHPCRRGIRPALDLGGAAVVRRGAAGARRADRGGHRDSARRARVAGPAGRLRPRPPRAAGDVPDLERAHRGRRLHRGAPDRPAAPPALPGHRQHRQPADERHQPVERVRDAGRRARPRAWTTWSG